MKSGLASTRSGSKPSSKYLPFNLGNEAGPHQLAHKWMYLRKVAAEQISECARREVEEFLVDYFNAKPCRSSTARNSVRTAWATRRAECSVQP